MNTRERWLLGVIVLLVAALVAVGIVLAVGGDDDEDAAESVTTTTLAPTTTEEEESPPVTIGIICTTPEDASMTLVESWIAGDQAAAARCASDTAVATIFENSGTGAQYTFQGCFGDPGVPTCSYTYEGGAVNLALSGTEASGWQVDSVSYIAD